MFMPSTPTMGGGAFQIADISAQDQLRQQLAQRMALLSSGKLA
jgi:hypothetical protein